MPSVSSFRMVSGALVVLIGMLPLTPPEHVHEAETEAGLHALIHRHGGSPFALHSHHDAAGDQAFDHIDGRTITLDASFMASPSYVAAVPPATVVAVLEVPPVVLVHGPTSDVERLIHGPPRVPSGLRAPPLTARL
jgi:hypothetical protein